MAVIEAVTRLVPGVMGNDRSGVEESFAAGLLEHPQYTRPAEFRDWDGAGGAAERGPRARSRDGGSAGAGPDHAIDRPDLIEARGGLDDADRALLDEFGLADGAGSS